MTAKELFARTPLAVPNFKATEWPAGTLEHMSADVIKLCQRIRSSTLYSKKIKPSPIATAHVRFDGSHTSRHYAAGRLSDATDVFIEGDPRNFLMAALACEAGGIGIYLDTELSGKPHPMAHIDLRHQPVCWVRVNKNEYVYLRNEPDRFWELLRNWEQICFVDGGTA